MKTVTPWTLTQLQKNLLSDLDKCQSPFERSMVKAIGGREIREKAETFSSKRKLTPLEVAIAQQYGWRN